MTLLEAIARDLRRPEEHLRLPADLLRQGYDPSYLARVRPDELNQLDAATLARLRRALRYRDNLEEIKRQLKAEGQQNGWWSDTMDRAVSAAGSAAELQVLTRNIKSRRSAAAVTANDPNIAKIATEILVATGSAPEDFHAWVKSQTGIEDDQVEPLLANVKLYIQALLLEDAALISKIFSFVKNRAVVQSSVLPNPNDAQGQSSDRADDAGPKRKRGKKNTGGQSTPKNDSHSTSAPDSAVTSEESVDGTSDNSSPVANDAAVTASEHPESVDDTPSQEQQSNDAPESLQESSEPTEALKSTEVVVEASEPTVEAINLDEIKSFQDGSKPKSTRAVSAKELSPRQRRRRWLKMQLEPYSKLRRSLSKLSPYQIVMLGRGSRSQILKVDLDYDRKAVARMARESIGGKEHPFAEFLDASIDAAMNGLLASRIEQEVFADAEEHSQQQLIEYAVEHLEGLLMQRPLRNHRIMLIDAIGTKSAAVVIVDPEGRIDLVEELPCNSTRPEAVNQNVKTLGEWAHDYNVSVIALSTGPARRYLMHSIREFMSQSDPSMIRWTMVDREGADTYCTTRLALQELPTLSKRHRAATWLAWRLQDPLVQLLKVEPTRLRLAVFQAELPPELVEESLKEAVASSVAQRGIDFWNGHQKALACVPGLDDQAARIVCEIRANEAPKSREALLAALSGKLPETMLRQAIGFLRIFESDQSLDGTLIHPDDYRLADRLIAATELTKPASAPEGWVKNVFVADDTTAATADLHVEAIDPAAAANEAFGEGLDVIAESEADDALEIFAETADDAAATIADSSDNADVATAASSENSTAESDETSNDDISSADAAEADTTVAGNAVESTEAPEPTVAPAAVRAAVKTYGGHPLAEISRNFSLDSASNTKLSVDVEKLARGWQVGREKLKFVAQVLQHPFADPRELAVSIPLMDRVPKIEDLKSGEMLWAIVSGIAEFGVFADLGPDCSGLIHVSRLSRNYVEDPHQVVNVGDLIQVWVVEVDVSKRRISLSALPPGVTQASHPHADQTDRGGSRPNYGGRQSHDNRGQHSGRGSYGGQGQQGGGQRQQGAGQQGSHGQRDRQDGGAPSRPPRGDGQRGGAQGGRSQDSQGNRGGQRSDQQQDRGDRSGGRNDRGGKFERRDNRGGGRGRDRDRGGRRGSPNIGAATVIDLPSKDLPANSRGGNVSSEPEGKGTMRSFGDLLARFQTKHEESKQPPATAPETTKESSSDE